MTEREIIAEMFRRYPVTEREKGCAAEKRKRDELRHQVRLRLQHEQRGEKKIFEGCNTEKQEMGDSVFPKSEKSY